MEIGTLGTIVSIFIAVAGAVFAVGKYLSSHHQTIKKLQDDYESLKNVNAALRLSVATTTSPEQASILQKLTDRCVEAQLAVEAAIYSISVPVPQASPTDLKIILSSDPKREKVIGQRIPITAGLAGWVYKRKKPSFKNPGASDPRLYDQVDRIAGTKTGEGAILTWPLISGGICKGVIQFMKPAPNSFSENDIAVAERYTQKITNLLLQLDEDKHSEPMMPADTPLHNVAIVFTDITGYSQIASHVRLQDSVAMLNDYYSHLLTCAVRSGGHLEEYVGDGLYISYRGEDLEQLARAAVASALKMQEEYANVLSRWKNFMHPVSDENTHSVGISTGLAYFGPVGEPSDRRKKLVGSPINRAAHLCAAGKGAENSIVICPDTMQLLGDDFVYAEEYKFRDGDCFRVLGSRNPG